MTKKEFSKISLRGYILSKKIFLLSKTILHFIVVGINS